jgi:hypothetical protein
MVLKSGAVIETAADSQVDMFLGANGPVVRITAATQLTLDKLAFAKSDEETVIDTQMDLKSGAILGNVKKLAKASNYQVKTPNGVCGIRGTEYKISASGAVTVVSGVVNITYVNPTTQQSVVVTVNAGETFVPPTATTPHQVTTTPPVEQGLVLTFRDETKTIAATPDGGPAITITPDTTTEPPRRQDETQVMDSKSSPGDERR